MVKRPSVDHTAMREMNINLILNTLRLHAPISRARVAALTGLNKTSVSNMVNELIRLNFVEELGIDDSLTDVGRPGINLRLNPKAGYLISAEIGVGFVSIIATNFAFEVIARRYEYTRDQDDQKTVLSYAFGMIDTIYQSLSNRGMPVFGLAVGVPGLVDTQTGTLMFAPNLNWHNVPLRALLAEQFNIPVVVSNEANMAAWGESYFGIAQHSKSLLYVSSGVGLGGGIVLNGQLMAGANGLAGEFGHMTVNPEGLRCRCGNTGCWETVATESALYRRVQGQVQAGRQSILANNLERLTVPLVIQAAENQDAVALEALHTTAHWIGVGIASLINALNPEHVVLGGSLSLAEKFILPIIHDEIRNRAFHWMREQSTLTIATHIADASIMGGIAMVHCHIIEHPMSWRTLAYTG